MIHVPTDRHQPTSVADAHRSSHGRRRLRWAAAAVGLAMALLLAACGDDSSAAAGPPSIRISAPADGGTVTREFDVELAPSVPIGEPDTGRHHVHLYYDGNRSSNQADYDIAYTTTFTVTRLAPGPHTIEAVIANADHSVTDAVAEVHVTVGDAPAGQAPPTTTSTGGYGY